MKCRKSANWCFSIIGFQEFPFSISFDSNIEVCKTCRLAKVKAVCKLFIMSNYIRSSSINLTNVKPNKTTCPYSYSISLSLIRWFNWITILFWLFWRISNVSVYLPIISFNIICCLWSDCWILNSFLFKCFMYSFMYYLSFESVVSNRYLEAVPIPSKIALFCLVLYTINIVFSTFLLSVLAISNSSESSNVQ